MNSLQLSNRFNLFPGIWIVLGMTVLFAARIAWKESQYPHQIKKLAQEFSSISIIQTRPVLNHAETQVGVVHTTEHGVGVFMADIKTRAERKLCEVKDYDYDGKNTALFGWSPGDKTFAFIWNEKLCFWAADGSKAVDETIPGTLASLFAWLSRETCVSIDSLSILHRFNFNEGRWQANGEWPLASKDGPARSLLALGTNAVAWQTSKTVWQMDLASGEMKRCYSTKSDIISMSYSENTGEFLLVVNTNKAKFSSLIAVARTTAIERSVAPDHLLIREAQWLNKGNGYLCRTVNGGVIAKADAASPEQTFFNRGGAQSIFGNDENSTFYAFAAATNEPPGVWKCQAGKDRGNEAFLQTGSLPSAIGNNLIEYAYPPWGDRDLKLHYQPVVTGYAPYENHNAKYALVPPANYSRHKKYPLVIGLSAYQWTPIAYATYAQCLAQSGAFVAFTGLVFGADDETRMTRFHAHTNNVLAVYNQLIANPSVDRERVYLFGFSQSTLILNDLVKDYPGRFRGIILLNPGGAPENLPLDARLKSVVATAGNVETWSWHRFTEYQTELCKLGVPMEWRLQSDSSHFERAQSTLRERTLLMVDTVFEGHSSDVSEPPEIPKP